MIEEVKAYNSEKILGVSRAFTHFLALSNTAENTHRIRKSNQRRLNATYGFSPSEDSCGGCITQLLKEGHPKEKIFEQLCKQSVEIVLTGKLSSVIFLYQDRI
jgi:phosphoenolpyruvate carboxylase